MNDPNPKPSKLATVITHTGEWFAEERQAWSLAHFLFDAFLTGAISLLVGWFSQMPWYLLVPLAVCIFGVVWSGFVLFRKFKSPGPDSQTDNATIARKDRHNKLAAREFRRLLKELKKSDWLDEDDIKTWRGKITSLSHVLYGSHDVNTLSVLPVDDLERSKQMCVVYLQKRISDCQ